MVSSKAAISECGSDVTQGRQGAQAQSNTLLFALGRFGDCPALPKNPF